MINRTVMSDVSLLKSLRSSFASSPVASSSVMVDPPQAQPQISPQPAPQVSFDEPAISTELTADDKLAIFGSVLDEIEAERQPVSPTPIPPVPQLAPQLAPQPIAPQPPQPDVVPSPPAVDLGAMAQAMPQVALQSTDTLNPATPVGTTFKESQGLSAIDTIAAEMGTALQAVETEKSPELSPEVESFLQKVEEDHDQAPQEIVLAGETAQAPSTTHHPSQPVVVLPITPDIEKAGSKANVHWSVRWLVEWSHKVVKMFTGKVIYREV